MWFLFSLITLIVVALVLLRVPAVQTRITQYLAKELTKRTGFPTSVGGVNIKWFDVIALEDLEVVDEWGEPMLSVASVDLRFSRRILLDPSNIAFGEAILHKPVMRAIRPEGEEMNVTIWGTRLRELAQRQDTTKPKAAFTLSLDRITLDGGEFLMRDFNRDSVPGFNYNHFRLTEISGTLPWFRVETDTIVFRIERLHAEDQASGLTIHDSESTFSFAQTFMKFSDSQIYVGESVIRDSMRFDFSSPRVLGYWVDSVDMHLWLHNSRLQSKELAYFVPEAEVYSDEYVISGEFHGTVSRFDVKDFVVAFGNNSVLNGDLYMAGAPRWEETFISLDLSAAQMDARDFKQYVPASAYPNVATFGKIRGSGQFIGFLNDFVTNGRFSTSLGGIRTDLNLKLDGDRNSQYSGQLALYNFNLGRLLKNPILGRVAMDGHVEGKGFTLESASMHLDANIGRLDLWGYSYSNIDTDADLAAELFEGKLSIEDPNLQFNMVGTIDITKDNPRVKANGLLDTCFLKELGWIEEESFIRTGFSLDAQGLRLDSITGFGQFKDLYIEYDGRSHLIDSVGLYSRRFANERRLQLTTDRLEIEAEGEFDLSPVLTDVQRLLYEYKINFSNNEDSISDYYANQTLLEPEPYHFNYTVRAINVNPFLNLFFPKLYIGEGTTVSGNFRGGQTYILSLYTEPDTAAYGDYRFGKTVLDMTTSKIFNEPDVLANIFLDSDTQSLPGFAPSQDLFFESVWFNQTIDFRGGVSQLSSGSLAELEGQVKLEDDHTEIYFLRSELEALDKVWDMDEGSRIFISNKEIAIDGLYLSQGRQRIRIDGVLSDSTGKALSIEVDSLLAENFNPLLEEPVSGVLNGYAKLSNPFDNLLVESQLTIDELTLSNFLLGDVKVSTKFDNEFKRLDVNGDLIRDGKRAIYIYGAYFPEDDNSLDMVASFDKANLAVAEPFFDDTFSNLGGTASGTFRIEGTLDQPLLKGTGTVNNGRARVNYLNTLYDFQGQIVFTENEIGFRKLEVRDENNSLAYLDGGIFHDGFSNFVFNLYGDFNNFQVMKTTAQDNEYYYGTGVATGSVEFLGSMDNLIISGNARTERGTRLYIPVDYSTTAEQAEFIKFVNLSDTTSQQNVGLDAAGTVDLSDINLDFDLDITPDAYVELIFDLKAGDIIRGRGRGELEFDIDNEGLFTMFGDLVIEQGGYNFTLYTLINKEFSIIPGSTITWTGDPYEADLDISATYSQLASIRPIMQAYSIADTSIVNRAPELNRRYPAQVLLYLEGDLMSPNIEFGVDVNDYPANINTTVDGNAMNLNLESAISAFKESLRTNEQEMKRQVFSLILLKRFSLPSSFDLGPSQALGSSVSELLSNQLSYWITQVDENLEIDVDIANLSEEAFDTFQLRLSYSFLDGRLRVTRDGNIVNDDPNSTVTSDLATLVGDWTVEYLLTPDGKFRLKMYNRNNYRYGTAGSQGLGETTTAGVSIMHTQSFNSIKELFSWLRQEKEGAGSSDDDPQSSTNTPNQSGTRSQEQRNAWNGNRD